MAYGNAGSITSAYLDLAAESVDEWANIGTNAIDWFSTHEPLIAILFDQSMQPNGDYQFWQLPLDGGIDWRVPGFGRGVEHAGAPAGITRANLINRIAPAIPSLLTTPKWIRSMYRGILFRDQKEINQNMSKEKMVDLAMAMKAQMDADAFQQISIDLWDNAAGAEDKVQSVNKPLANDSTVAGVDQTDTANNSWWNAGTVDSTAEVWNLTSFNRGYDAITYDTPVATGVSKKAPDICFLYGDLFSVTREALTQNQRIDYSDMARGGAKYIEANGVRFFRNTRQVADTVVLMNSRSFVWRYVTKFLDWVTPGFVPVDATPGMWQRGWTWEVSAGYLSCKHNQLFTNKRAS